jgi:pimeloyl-ACP methyl ester carboxylesterase
MLHGFRGNHDGLADMVQYLDGYRLILPDLPGYGESEPLDIPHIIRNYVTWLDNFIAALDLIDFVVWGQSFSGSIALIHASEGIRKPVATIGAPPAAVRRGPPRWITTWYYQIGGSMPEPLRMRWLTSRTVDRATGRLLVRTASGALREAILERRDRILPTLNARVITEQYMSLLDTNLEFYAATIKIPVLIIAGARDIIVPLHRLHRLVSLMPQGVLEVMHDQGHMAPLERPAETASITKRFVDGLPQGSANGYGQ